MGHYGVHVCELGLIASPDTAIWDYAINNNCVVITKDEDFAIRVIQAASCPAIVWVRIGNCGNAALIEWLAPLFPSIVSALESGEKLVELA